ncbi:MAG TPA: right-handed parallel beta-helix repeat-containing protein, partial [Crenotrichaceae bacterium]|nr:right-handed parallel beta-helix repeat-containing protein [Crenotrichaceae bacterium]
ASKQASMPWGVIVLFGQQANNSTLSHCELSGGSGFKGDLFEYTAMLSIHNVNNVSISHCVFSNNKITDDMVHAVYSELSIDNSSFINAFADALDIDISNVEIIDSLFLNSGNDALDLMTAEVTVVGSTFRHSGDKGMSVGENSRLLAIDNYISDNSIGIQAKDNSDALLFNQTIVNNQKAIDVYKKNWRYGSGGHISVAKSVIRDNDHAITTGKQSKVSLFDSYLDTPYSGKKIAMSLVDNKNVIATSNILFLDDLMDKRTKTMLDNAPAHVYGRIQTNLRGAYTAVRK